MKTGGLFKGLGANRRHGYGKFVVKDFKRLEVK